MNMTINVLYIIERLGHGGTELQLVELMNGLDKSMFSPHLCTLKPSFGLFSSLDIPKIELRLDGMLRPDIFPKIRKMLTFCRRHRIHLIQTFFQDPPVIAAVLKLFLPVMLIYSFRDLGFWRTPLESVKTRTTYFFFDGFVANSHAVKNYYHVTDGLSVDKIRVIHNGFDMQKVKQKDSNAQRVPVVGIVGNFNRPVKRMGDFIECAGIIKEAVREARFIVVGDGAEKNRLMHRTSELGLKEAFLFVGRVENALEYIHRFAIGVNTSETEGFSNAVMEYMACGVPVVATDAGGNRELVENGKNGYLVPVGDCAKMAEKIIKLLLDPELRFRMGKDNRQEIGEKYTMEAMVRNYERLYRSFVM